ncbi:MAG: DNA primase [Gammaproteobacteria bacterium]|nr:MAG: DNA primase [Gammaproteobacteria bacterium]
MAGRIPREFIDELLTRVDIVDVIDAHVPLRKAGKDFVACCPFHTEKTPSFSVSRNKQFYYCFGCGASGSAIGFLMDYLHLGFVEAVRDLAARVGLEVPEEAGMDATPRRDLEPIYEALEQACGWYRRQLREHPSAGRAIDYLKGRGLSGEVAARFELGYAPPGWDNLSRALPGIGAAVLERAGLLIRREEGGHYDRFRDRVIFPIRDRRGRCIGFGGRVIGTGEPKYLNSPETPVFHKGRELYGMHLLGRAAGNEVLVVEGYMDVVALAQFGVDHAVATLGTATTREHLERLFRVTHHLVFCFDGDQAGRRAAWRALEQALELLHEGRTVDFLFMPEGEDPDSLVRREGAEAFADHARRVPLSGFLFDHLQQGVDLGALDGRARLVDLAMPLLRKVPEGAFRRLLLQRLSELSRLQPDELRVLLDGDSKRSHPSVRPARMERHRPSLVRELILALLHRPELGKLVDGDALGKGDLPGLALLAEIAAYGREHPQATTGQVLEHWRDRPEGEHLRRLLAREQLVEPDDLERHFRDGLQRLEARLRSSRLQALLHKRDLDAAEQEELRGLLGHSG